MLNGNANHVFQLNADGATYRDLLRDMAGNRNDQGEPFNNYKVNPVSAIAGAQATSRTPLLVGKLRELPDKVTGETVPMLNEVTSIPTEVFIAWAAAHPKPILQKIEAKNDQYLTARYDDKATFTLPLVKQKLATTRHIATLLNNQKSNDGWASTLSTGDESRGR